MSFHKRRLSLELISSHARSSDFRSFEIYMTNSDVYMFSSDESTAYDIWTQFGESDEAGRKTIYESLKNNQK